ncbi:MAG: site-specific DNA-methyltransferase [Armatimonadetes bacterium]|nr:site-specific DNA-methyltransferase [Armatimonadota bacterium]
MAHMSEDSRRLDLACHPISKLEDLRTVGEHQAPAVYMLHLPAGRSDSDAAASGSAFREIETFCTGLPEETVVSILTTPPDAARLALVLESVLQLQLWVAVKLKPEAVAASEGGLPENHAALLIFSRYRGALKHTKTRIGYTYCPACGKTTKDYGGKKHVYHEYGTLMSDVWRDIACDPRRDIEGIADRLRDVFGLEPYRTLRLLDMRSCYALAPQRPASPVLETELPMEWDVRPIPQNSRLVNADCLETLKGIPDNSIDFCFADPPYNLEKKYDRWNDALESMAYFDWCDRWLSELARILKSGRTLAVLNIPQWSIRHYRHLASILKYQSWIAWEALSFPVRMIMPAHYALLCFSKGEPRPLPGCLLPADPMPGDLLALRESFCLRASCIAQRQKRRVEDRADITDLWHDIHRLKHNTRRVDHPCQLPPQLMRRLYAVFTDPGEIVLDCFNGAGTSALVARQMERRFIGIELSTKYHELALKRHEQIERGEDPFGKTESVPESKNSRVERLPRQKYKVSKKALQLDVRRIARQLGRLPRRDEVASLSRYPIEYYETYFFSWGEVCAAARTTGMSELPQDAVSADTLQMGLRFDEG